MILGTIFLYLYVLNVCYADWMSEWMGPVQEQLDSDSYRLNNDYKILEENDHETPVTQDITESLVLKDIAYRERSSELSTANLKKKLDITIRNAKALAETLRNQIIEINSKENLLKEAITTGRHGVSTVTVSTLNQVPRSYIIREDRWALCNGMIQLPMVTSTSTDIFNTLFLEPRCIGREVVTAKDPCVFNSIIKYAVLPTRRTVQYSEEDYLCLKHTINNTLERYESVSRQLINQTCKDGIIRSLAENKLECGIRIMADYNFYPDKSSSGASLPLEYCTEKDGSCKLILGWHVSNASIENYEFLRNEQNFKQYFINNGPYVEHIL